MWRVVWTERWQWWPSCRDFDNEAVARLFAWVLADDNINATVHWIGDA